MTMHVLRQTHRWLGLALALPLILQGLSGAILALEPVLPAIVTNQVSSAEPQPASRVIAAAVAAVEAGWRPTRYTPAKAAGDSAIVQFAALAEPGGRGPTVLVDPASLAILGGEQGTTRAIDWIRSFHTEFLVRDRGGRSVVGWTGVGLLFLTILGVLLWWPRPSQVRAAFTIDWRARGVGFHRRLHGAAGIWSVLLLLTTAMTGVVLAFPQTARSVLGLPPNAVARTQRAAPPGDHGVPDIDAAIVLARETVPDARVRMVMLPARPTDLLRVMMSPLAGEGVASLTTVTIDPFAPRVVSLQDRRSLSVAEMTLRWTHDLHFGQGLGPIWRASTIATGLMLPIFAVTGSIMWLLKRRRPQLMRRAASLGGG